METSQTDIKHFDKFLGFFWEYPSHIIPYSLATECKGSRVQTTGLLRARAYDTRWEKDFNLEGLTHLEGVISGFSVT